MATRKTPTMSLEKTPTLGYCDDQSIQPHFLGPLGFLTPSLAREWLFKGILSILLSRVGAIRVPYRGAGPIRYRLDDKGSALGLRPHVSGCAWVGSFRPKALWQRIPVNGNDLQTGPSSECSETLRGRDTEECCLPTLWTRPCRFRSGHLVWRLWPGYFPDSRQSRVWCSPENARGCGQAPGIARPQSWCSGHRQCP